MYKELSVEKYIPQKYRPYVEEFWKDIDGCWLNLKDDYISTTTEASTIHENSIKEVKKCLKTIMLEEEYLNSWKNKQFMRKDKLK
ncbi:hypothetical protein [Staphylococcus durrellii]|uniref:hypothetical protein n=1 Tax=Staphylococcus durrellii TaxID=2781773 RepID=UPI0018A0D14F|nr:hypothetical protein [Staphylococcus durrellii]MBF7018246.1 hypothetical protein [Staphylococcus durrellii]